MTPKPSEEEKLAIIQQKMSKLESCVIEIKKAYGQITDAKIGEHIHWGIDSRQRQG